MSDLSVAALGFSVDTSALKAATDALDRLAARGAVVEAALARMAAASGAAFAKVSAGAASASGAPNLAAQVAQQAQLGAATDGTTAKIRGQSNALRDAAAAHGAHGKAVYGNTLQMMELGHVGRALFDELAAGGNIFRALALEGGRLQLALSTGEGGLTGLLGRLGTRAAGLVNPFSVGATAVVGLGAAALYAASSYRSLQDELGRSVTGVGRFSGLSGEGLGALARASAGQTGIGYVQSAQNAAALAGTGKLDAGNIAGVLGLTRGYAGAFGTDLGTAGQQLGDIFGDPVKGAEKLNQRLGFLDDRTRQYIRTLRDQGDAQGAVRALVDASSTALNEQATAVSGIARSMRDLKDATDTLGRVASGGLPQTALERYEQAARNVARGAVRDPFSPLSATALDTRATAAGDDSVNAAESVRFDAIRAGAIEGFQRSRQADLLARSRSTDAGDVIRGVEPDLGRYSSLLDQRDKLQSALNDPNAAKLIDPAAARDAQDALDRLNAGISTFKTSAQQAAETSQFMVAALQANTAADKLAIDVQRTYADVLGRTHSALEAAVAAEAKRSEAIASSNKQAEDAAQTQRDADALLGLRPAQRLAAERQQALDDADQKYDGLGGVRVPTGAGAGAYAQAPAAIQSMIDAAAAQTSIPASIIAAIGQKENGFRLTGGTSLLGSDGRPSSAYGFGQLTNGAAADVAARVPGFNKYDPNTAVFGSAEYLRVLLDRNNGNLTAALHGYGGTDSYAADIARRAGGGIALPSAAPTATALGTARTQAGAHYDAQYANLIRSPLDAAQDALAQRQAAQAITEQSAGFARFGMAASAAAGKLAELDERQNLLNTYMRAGVTVTPDLQAKIDDLARKYGDAAKSASAFAAQQHQVIDALDGVRSGFGDGLSTFVNDLERGKSIAGSFRDVLEQLGQTIQRAGLNAFTNSLFGQQGQSGGGLFGGLLGSAFGGLGGLFGGGGGSGGASLNPAGLGHNALGTDDWRGGLTVVGEKGPELINVQPHAQIIPNSALAGMRSGPPNVTVGGHTIIVQGDASKAVLDEMDRRLAAANQQQYERIVRDMPSIQAASRQTSPSY